MRFLKTLIAIILASCAALVCAADADPPAVVGRLNYLSGAVSFAPAEANEDWAAAALNRPLTTGDRLWTDAGGRAELHVGSLAVRMDSLTSLDLLNLDDRGLQLRLAQGNVNLRVRRSAGSEPVEIATPAGAVVLSRPGSYRVSVDPQGAAAVVAVRGGGQAEVFAAHGSFLVSDGQQTTITSARQDLAVAPAPDEFDRWASARDQREERVAATRYVPAEMTGYEDLDEYGAWRTVPEYGTVWQPTAVPAGWAPYRYGHWVWVSPWGWTWVDDAPWGFAPFHYGRWVWLGSRWAWAPGRIVARPVYAPALVAFLGGPNFSVSISARSAPAVGWVPLGWREPYRPWYRASTQHVRNVNITQVTNVTNVTNIRYVNRSAPSGVTVVSRENFVAARPVQPAALRVSQRTIAAAPVATGSPVAAPSNASLAQARAGARPPAEVRNREAIAVSAPPAPARTTAFGGREPARGPRIAAEERPPVRVIARQERVNPAQAEAQRGGAEKRASSSPQGGPAGARERPAEKAPAPSQPQQAGERRVPAPPAEVTARPTYDRAARPQAVPQPDTRSATALEAQRAQQRDGERQRAQQVEQQRAAQEEQARRQAEGQQQERQRAQQDRERAERQQQAQQPARTGQQAQERSQQQTQQQQAQRQAEEQARQRQAQQQARTEQRVQQQAQQQQAEQQAQRRAEEQARQQQAQQQQAQRAQQQAQQQARAEQQAQQRAQQQAQQQQQQAQRAQQQAQQQAQQHSERPRRAQETQEKGGRERPRGEKAEKAEKG